VNNRHMQNRILFFILFISLILLLIISVFYKQIFQKIGDYLLVKDDLVPVDVIHVIAGDDYRSEYAFQLYKQGLSKYIFFTGGWCKYHGYYHGNHGKELAIQNDIPESAIAYDDSNVKSTYDEILLLKKWIDVNPNKIKSILIVSDPFHMRRSKWIVNKIFGGEINVIMAPVPMDWTISGNNWWQDKTSRKYIIEEYVKLVYYFFRYQLSINWLGVFDTE